MNDIVAALVQFQVIYPVLTVVLFTGSCYAFIRSVLKPVPVLHRGSYSLLALRLKKTYAIFSWGLLTFVFMLGLVVSFYDVYTTL